ncbi:MAG TPA: sugar phosphate isomerase/epimerase family protein [Terriglobia bacterium]|nr:sugar phosphate isomerase/epimerase family protein [Terriglobia bacterium]
MNKKVSRREFLQASVAGAVMSATARPFATPNPPSKAFRGTLCLFSKPVPQLNWRELARNARQAGFDGIDLTVRTEGHVLPERVATDLPRAVAAIREEGLEVPMITTALLSADDPTAKQIISTAGELSIPYLKPGYYRYKLVNVLQEVDGAGRQLRSLVELAKDHGIQVGYHNHPRYIGEAIWDMARVIEPLDPQWCGFYFDLCQATMEGGVSGWRVATSLVLPRLKMIAAKDFVWKQTAPHEWRAETCPMGEGMSNWKEFFKIVAQSDFHGPVSLQQEFAIPGAADHQGIAVSRKAIPRVIQSAKENLDYLKSVIREAYERA